MIEQARRLNSPQIIFMLALALTVTGIVFVYSASASQAYLTRQVIYAFMGMAALGIAYFVDLQLLRRHAFWIMLAGLVGCFLVFIPGIGVGAKGAQRWIGLPGFTLQPSEFAKLALVIYMAKMLADRRPYIKTFFSGMLPAMIITGLFAFVIVLEPDFGAAFVLCAVIFGMWLAASMRWFHLLGLVITSIPAALGFFLMEDYRWKRLVAFVTMDESAKLGAGFQLNQSLIAVGSGGWTGRGLGNSQAKFSYISEAHNDFIFAIMAEELGFLRITLVVLMFMGLTLFGWRVALRATDLFSGLLAAGISLMIFISTSFNMCVVLGMLPTKGLVLPFTSYGGTALLVSMTAIGLLMNIARRTEMDEPSGGRRKKKRARA